MWGWASRRWLDTAHIWTGGRKRRSSGGGFGNLGIFPIGDVFIPISAQNSPGGGSVHFDGAFHACTDDSFSKLKGSRVKIM